MYYNFVLQNLWQLISKATYVGMSIVVDEWINRTLFFFWKFVHEV